MSRYGLLIAAVCLCVVAVHGRIQVPSPTGEMVDHPLTLEDGVKDPVFSFLVNLAFSRGVGTLTPDEIGMALGDRKSRVPYQEMKWIERRVDGEPAVVQVDFGEGLDIPIPYSILGYNPGDVRASGRLRFGHWMLEPMELTPEGDEEVSRLTDIHLLVLQEGRMEIDIDGWLDRLLGKRLDDTQVGAMVLFRMDGRLYGIATGTNSDGKGRSGSFDLGEDKVVFPSSAPLKQMGRRMRAKAEQLAASTGPGPRAEPAPDRP